MSPADRALFAPGQLTYEESIRKEKARDERQLQGWLVGMLRIRGHEPLWFRTDKRTRATVGWPDITFALFGRACAWEVKMPGNYPTDDQLAVHAAMTVDGWTVCVVTSVDEGRSFLESFTDCRPV
jgi:hypothetical protein